MATIDELNIKISADIKGLRSQTSAARTQIKSFSRESSKALEKLRTSAKKLSGVKISPDTKGLQRGINQSNKRLKALGKRLKTTKKSVKSNETGLKSLGGRFTNLASSIAIVQGPLGGIAGRFTTVGALIKRVNIATIASIGIFTALSVVLGKSVANFIPFQKITLRIGAVLKATGREAETSVRRLDRFATQLGKATLTSRSAVLEAAAALATFQNIKTDQFETILTKAQDLSAVFGGDLKSNTILLARALSAPGEAFTILERRVGKFTKAERELLLELQNTGRIAEAQAVILKKLEVTTGAAEREAKGLAGSTDTLGESFFNLSITIAKVTGVAKGFKKATDGISTAIFNLRKRLGDIDTFSVEDLESKIKSLEDEIKAVEKRDPFDFLDEIPKLTKKIEPLKKALEELTRGIDTKPIDDSTKSFFELFESARTASDEIAKGFSDAIIESRNNLTAFSNFAENILNKIAADILRTSVTEPLVKGIFEAFKIKSLPGFGDTKGKALGGPIQANQPVIVGERGPELLIPRTSGTVIPNNKMGGGGITVVQNFTIATGADISLIDQKIMAAAPIIASQAQIGIIEGIQIGGRASQLVGRKF